MAGLLEIEPLYCAEQIRIPADLPEVLKEYSKAVIRANPPDVLAFSLQYFNQLANHASSLSAAGVRHLASKFAEADPRGRGAIAREVMEGICRAEGFPESAANNLLRLMGAQETVAWQDFCILACTLICPTPFETACSIFEVFGDQTRRLSPEKFSSLLRLLAQRDSLITADIEDALVGELKSAAVFDGQVCVDDFRATKAAKRLPS